jgi:hypothetical protein
MQVVVVVVAALAISGTREMRSPGGCLQDLGTLSGSSLQISKPPQLQAARDECRPAQHCRHCYYSYYYREEPEDAQTNRPYFKIQSATWFPIAPTIIIFATKPIKQQNKQMETIYIYKISQPPYFPLLN